MIPQQAIMTDAPSPDTPSRLPADAAATVTGTDIIHLAGLQPQPVEWPWQHSLAAATFAIWEVDLDFTAQTRPSSRSSQLPGEASPPVNGARWPNQLLGHLGHLRETKDSFGNVAKSRSEGKSMSLLLKVPGEGNSHPSVEHLQRLLP